MTEEPPKGGHQGFRDTGEKALGERGKLEGAAKAKRTEDTTSTLEEKTSTPRDQTRKRLSSPTYNQGTAAKRLPKGSHGGRRAAEEEHRQEETITKEPAKGGCQDRGAATGELPKGSNQGRETAKTDTTTHQEGIIKAREPQKTSPGAKPRGDVRQQAPPRPSGPVPRSSRCTCNGLIRDPNCNCPAEEQTNSDSGTTDATWDTGKPQKARNVETVG